MVSRAAVYSLIVLALCWPAAAQVSPGAGQPAPDPRDMRPAAVINAARERFEAGLHSEALDLLRNVLKAAPGHVDSNLLAGEILMDDRNPQPDFDGARNCFRQVMESEPSNFRANLGLGKIALANHSWRQATAYLMQAETVAPLDNRAEVKRLLAEVYATTAQVDKGLEKAQEAMLAAPDDPKVLSSLIAIRQIASARDPRQLERAAEEGQRLLAVTKNIVQRDPWNRETLNDLNNAYSMLLRVLQDYHNTFYQRNVRNEPIDVLLPGKGTDAAAVLMETAEIRREYAVLGLIFAEQEALVMADRAISDNYAPRNIKYLEKLVATCQQLESLTARLIGSAVLADTTLRERAIDACQRILELDESNQLAQQYLEAVGATPTPPPAEPESETED